MKDFLIYTISYFALFIIGLFVCGKIINGIYIATRGETITAPDGTQKDQGDMIFYPVYKWLTKIIDYYYIQYKGEQLADLLTDISKKFGNAPSWTVNGDVITFTTINTFTAQQMYDGWLLWVNDYLKSRDIVVKHVWSVADKYVHVELFEKYPIYRFSKYIRKPIIQCIKCMSSFWGTLFYWSFIWCLFNEFNWLQVPIWIAFCFALSWVNVYLFNKVQ